MKEILKMTYFMILEKNFGKMDNIMKVKLFFIK